MKCSLLTRQVLHWIQEGRSARLLHVFDEVCNLVDEDGEVISLVTPTIGPGPFTMVIEGDFRSPLSSFELQQAIAIRSTRKGLSIGPLFIATDGASLWNAKPHWSRLRHDSGDNWPPPTSLPKHIDTLLQRLLEGIRRTDSSAAVEAATSLAGLGSGLTPAGDDVMLGVLYALWIWLPQKEWIELIIETAAPRTTTLSAAFLNAAADGEATVHWHNLVNGCPKAPQQILAIGHSSGSDAWTGFLRAREKFSLNKGQ